MILEHVHDFSFLWLGVEVSTCSEKGIGTYQIRGRSVHV